MILFLDSYMKKEYIMIDMLFFQTKNRTLAPCLVPVHMIKMGQLSVDRKIRKNIGQLSENLSLYTMCLDFSSRENRGFFIQQTNNPFFDDSLTIRYCVDSLDGYLEDIVRQMALCRFFRMNDLHVAFEFQIYCRRS